MCGELYTPLSPPISYSLAGVDIICNSSASHWSLRNLDRRLSFIPSAARRGVPAICTAISKVNGAGRQYYDACSLKVLSGDVVAQACYSSTREVEVIAALVNLEERWLGQFHPARRLQAVSEPTMHTLRLLICLASKDLSVPLPNLSRPFAPVTVTAEEEIAQATGCWLFDYLRRSRKKGFFLPLSVGISSAATALSVHSAARMI